jgi:bifunctional non-homologous end joining protein LigD
VSWHASPWWLCRFRQRWPRHKKIAHRDIWAVPSLSAEIEYRGKSAKGKVRHPFFKGIREDL